MTIREAADAAAEALSALHVILIRDGWEDDEASRRHPHGSLRGVLQAWDAWEGAWRDEMEEAEAEQARQMHHRRMPW